MVGRDSSENMVIASMWSSMAAWFTPVVLFGLMNLIVAIIFIANNNNNNNKKINNKQNEQDQHEDYDQVRGGRGGDIFTRLTRVNSLFERVKSINVTSFISTATTAATTKAESHSQQQNPLATYSSLSRLAQSIHFPTLHGTRSTGGESTQSEKESPRRTTTGRNRSSLERIKSVRFEKTDPTESSQISDSLSQLVRAPSFVLERVKSLKMIKIPSPFKSGAPITESEGPIDRNSIRSKSEKSSSAAKKSAAVEIKKTRSEIRLPASDGEEEEEDYDSRRPATAREARNSGGDAGVDAKADDFITRFRQQLKLQRVESLVRYNDILQRRTSH